MNYGEKIAYLRKSKGMTQEDLGKILSVTYQAVSKWERGESLPDFTTMSQIAKFFQVPLEYFEDGADLSIDGMRVDTSASEKDPDDNIIGMCTVCGKALKTGDEYSDSPKLVCKSCKDNQARAETAACQAAADAARRRAAHEAKLQRGSGIDAKLIVCLVFAAIAYIALTVTCFVDKTDDLYMLATILALLPLAAFAIPFVVMDLIAELRDKDDGPEGYTLVLSLVIGAVFAVVNIAVFAVLYASLENSAYFFILMGVGAVVSFTFISQFMWGSAVREIFTCGGFTFKLPGVIFSLTPESIIMMILIKIFLGIVSVLIFIVTTIFFAAVAILGSVFTFIPCVIYKVVKDRAVAK